MGAPPTARPIPRWAPYVLFLVVFAWFASHAVPSLYFGDVGELLAAIHTGGVPHPTGFPVLLLLGYLPSQIGTLPLNLLHAAIGALAVVLLSLWASRAFSSAAFYPTACVLLGSSTLLLHATVTRVYVHQLATFAAVLLLVHLFRPTIRWALAFGFALGLALGTHLLAVSALLYAAIVLLPERGRVARVLPWALVGALLSLSLYLWLPLRAHANPSVAWASPDSLQRLLDYLTQREYGAKMFSRDHSGSLLFLRALARVFWMEWNPMLWLLAAWGLVRLLKSSRTLAWGLLSVPLFNILLLFAYGDSADLDILYRYFLPTYAVGAAFTVVAALDLYDRWVAPRWDTRLTHALSLASLLALCLGFPAVRGADLSRSTLARDYLRDLLRPLPPSATAILSGDHHVFPCAYARYVLGLRPDLRWVEWGGQVFPEGVQTLAREGALTQGNLEDRWYVEGGGSLFVSVFREIKPPFLCRPYGLLYRLSDLESERRLPSAPRLMGFPPRVTQAERRDPESWGMLGSTYLMAAASHEAAGQLDQALKDAADAVEATPRCVITLLNSAMSYRNHGLLQGAEAWFLRALELEPDKFETHLQIGILYGKMGRYDDCRRHLLFADKKRPGDPKVEHYLRRLDSFERRDIPLGGQGVGNEGPGTR